MLSTVPIKLLDSFDNSKAFVHLLTYPKGNLYHRVDVFTLTLRRRLSWLTLAKKKYIFSLCYSTAGQRPLFLFSTPFCPQCEAILSVDVKLFLPSTGSALKSLTVFLDPHEGRFDP